MARVHSPGSDTQDYASSDVEEREDGDEDAVQEADKERSTRCRRRTKGAVNTVRDQAKVEVAAKAAVEKKKQEAKAAKEKQLQDERIAKEATAIAMAYLANNGVAAVTGATTTDLMVGNVTGAGGKKVKKRKRVNEVAKEEVSEEEKEVSEVEEEEEEEKEEKEEEETDATNATGINCYVLQCINNVVATLFRAYLFLNPFRRMATPLYLAKANHWVRALLR